MRARPARRPLRAARRMATKSTEKPADRLAGRGSAEFEGEQPKAHWARPPRPPRRPPVVLCSRPRGNLGPRLPVNLDRHQIRSRLGVVAALVDLGLHARHRRASSPGRPGEIAVRPRRPAATSRLRRRRRAWRTALWWSASASTAIGGAAAACWSAQPMAQLAISCGAAGPWRHSRSRERRRRPRRCAGGQPVQPPLTAASAIRGSPSSAPAAERRHSGGGGNESLPQRRDGSRRCSSAGNFDLGYGQREGRLSSAFDAAGKALEQAATPRRDRTGAGQRPAARRAGPTRARAADIDLHRRSRPLRR